METTTSIDELPNLNEVNVNNNSPPQNLNYSSNNNNSNINNIPLKEEKNFSSSLNELVQNEKSITDLPSRDIPINDLQFNQDSFIKQNSIPINLQNSNENNDYIGNILDKEKILTDTIKENNYYDNLDYIYNLFQLPILIGLLFFIFQLPFVKSKMFFFLPMLYHKDGNPNLLGYIINSIFFATLFILVQKLLFIFKN